MSDQLGPIDLRQLTGEEAFKRNDQPLDFNVLSFEMPHVF